MLIVFSSSCPFTHLPPTYPPLTPLSLITCLCSCSGHMGNMYGAGPGFGYGNMGQPQWGRSSHTYIPSHLMTHPLMTHPLNIPLDNPTLNNLPLHLTDNILTTIHLLTTALTYSLTNPRYRYMYQANLLWEDFKDMGDSPGAIPPVDNLNPPVAPR